MSGVNKVIILGRLGADPEVKRFENGVLCNIRIATDSKWTDKASGEQREETEWHHVVLRGRQAEVAGEYLKKGSQVYIEGRIKTRKWQDKEGADRYSTEIQANVMQLIGSAPAAKEAPAPAPAAKKPAAKKAAPVPGPEDDIPF